MLKVFRPCGPLYPGNVMVNSGIYARTDVAAKRSHTGDPDYIEHAIMVRVINDEWSSTAALEQKRVYSINLLLLTNSLC